MGLQLKHVHCCVKYLQEPWLKEYINFNSEHRAFACSQFLEAFCELKNNALFGKAIEDVRKRIKYLFVTDEDRFRKLAQNLVFNDGDIINGDIVGVHMLKAKVILNKPIFVGQTVLDYSKLQMYKLFYLA